MRRSRMSRKRRRERLRRECEGRYGAVDGAVGDEKEVMLLSWHRIDIFCHRKL